MPDIRRVNFWAGPASGKSTTAAILFGALKRNWQKVGPSVELIQEFVKTFAWQTSGLDGYDQFFCFANQLRSEDLLLRNGVGVVVSDSPLMLNAFYAAKNTKYGSELITVAKQFEEEYPSLNIFLDRGAKPYDNRGRFHSKEQAIRIDEELKIFMTDHLIPYSSFAYDGDFNKLFEFVLGKVDRY